jgi:hypothetical protein
LPTTKPSLRRPGPSKNLPAADDRRAAVAVDAMPASWLVALQLYRVFGGWALAGWVRGALPGAWALPAGSGDVLTALFALPSAIALATGTA